MDLPRLIDALTNPTAYPYPVERVEVRQTHISAVFLAGASVYKIKKSVDPGFLDFTTLEKRLHFCREEVRLNRRLAPDVYLGVVPVVQTPHGVRIEAEGEVLEWAVKMKRLPDESTVLERLRRTEVNTQLVEAIAQRIAAFHRAAETNKRIASFGRFDVVAKNIRDVFDRAAPHIATTASRSVFDRTRQRAEETLARLRPLIEERATQGGTRDCHGDLHLDHIYSFPEQAPPGDLVIIDCIEFNERFRFIDPVADMAFAAMDLAFHGRRDLSRAFADAYFRASEDEEGRELLPLYTAYRASVRGMVDGLLLAEKEVPESERSAASVRARAHWLVALTELERPSNRPGLLLVMGLPGSGKSTLARMLGASAGFEVIRSDVIRKNLAGLPPHEPSPQQVRESLYSPEWTDRTYAECLSQAEKLLGQGRRVIVDATFHKEHQRRAFLDSAIRFGEPAGIFVCEAHPETIRQRLEARRGDASDADWSVYLRVASSWETPGTDGSRLVYTVSMEGTAEQALSQSLAILRQVDLLDE